MGQAETILLDFKQTKDFIDRKLREYIASEDPLLHPLQESIRYSLFSGGKRIRPLFSFIIGDLFGISHAKLVPLSCAIEMIHAASLIMDDLPHMDGAMTRRGKPANHIVFGQDVAALASIGLMMKAYEIILADPLLTTREKTNVARILVNAVGVNGMVGGQFVDLRFPKESLDHHVIEYIHDHKTVALFSAAGEAAGVIGGATTEDIKAVTEYARNVGFAFQILDDLLDFSGAAEEVGKPVHQDRLNFVSLYGPERSKELVEMYTNRAIETTRIFGNRNAKLVALAHMLLDRKT
ncbi:MAG: Farnesyl diphosphate synthase [Syntrophorhabdus sp. PtaU1.Bin050]|nr:MAG: Farnesyl diphosphate synthase [Syntrophorhabdus sp. PtaU1.Bin050]